MHSSCMSTRIAPTSRMTAASFGKMPTTRARRLISLLTRSSGLVEPDLAPVRPGKAGEREHLRPWPRPSAVRSWGSWRRARRGSCPMPRRPHLPWAGRRSCGTLQRRCRPGPSARAPRGCGRSAPGSVGARCLETAAQRRDEAGVLVGDDQLDPVQAALLEGGEEPAPEHLVLAVADVQTEDLPLTGGGDAGRHHDGHGLHLRSLIADVEVGGVEVDPWGAGVVQPSGAERTHDFVERLTDAGDLGCRSPTPRPSLRPGRRRCGSTSLDVGLHHNRVQGLVDPAAGSRIA